MMSYLLMLLFLTFVLLVCFITNSSHIINLLLILESIMLILLTFLFMMLVSINMNPYMFLTIMSFSACEAALGLSILVSLMRFHGNDYLMSISSMKW